MIYRQPGMLMLWSHEPLASWQTPEWLQQMREQLRTNAYVRMIENRFVSSESEFVDMTWWDACTDLSLRPVIADPNLQVWLGVDASVKKDSTAIAACTFDSAVKRVRLVCHKIFQPSPREPLDFEKTIEATLLDLNTRFQVRAVRYDPYQMVSSAQRLLNAGVPMVEFPQSVPNLTEASQNLYDLIKGRNLIVYRDADIRLAVSRCVAIESARGWKISKEKQTHKIDVVVALAQAALGAVQKPVGWIWDDLAKLNPPAEAQDAPVGPVMPQKATKPNESCPVCSNPNLTCYADFVGCGQCGWVKGPDEPIKTPPDEPSAEELARTAAEAQKASLPFFLRF